MECPNPKDGVLFLLQKLFLVFCVFANTYVFASPTPVLRVLIEQDKSSVIINGFDLHISSAIQSDSHHKFSVNQKTFPLQNQISIRCQKTGVVDVRGVSGKESSMKAPVSIHSLGGFLRIGNAQYRDDLYVYSKNKECFVVNHVDLEKYVAGLLDSEMSARWSLSTLQAQAVAARTYALFQMQQGKKLFFDVESTVKDQVYEGAHKEKHKALLAVRSTRGEVLTFNEKPIKAFYHSTCGGKTETPEKVWGGSKLPYLKSVPCVWCGKSPRFAWSFALTQRELEGKLKSSGLWRGSLKGIKVLSRTQLNRAQQIEIKSFWKNTVLSASKFREVVGNEFIRSTDFDVLHKGTLYIFTGKGSGHGVGMCQWGAKTMGDSGRSYHQILKNYYPLAKLNKMY